jgi:hypothetical protein
MEDLGVRYQMRKNHRGKRNAPILREDGDVLGDIEPARLPSGPLTSMAFCNDKILTTNALLAKGVGVPDSRTYLEHEGDIAYDESFCGKDEVVVKAHSITLGQGVFAGGLRGWDEE